MIAIWTSESVSSVTQSWTTLCDPMDFSTPSLPVHHQLPEFTQTHVHWVGDAIQSLHPLSSPSPPTFNLSQHQDLFKWVSFLHQVATKKAEHKGTLLHCWWERKLVQPLWGTVWRFLTKLYRELPYDPEIPLLAIHTEETRIERDTCTPMFIAALFTIGRTGKQLRCPSADECIESCGTYTQWDITQLLKRMHLNQF